MMKNLHQFSNFTFYQHFIKFITGFMVLFMFGVIAPKQLKGQTAMSLPLTHPNNGATPITPQIDIPVIQFQPLNLSVLMDGAPLPLWLIFTQTATASTLTLEFKIAAGQCVPVPPVAGIDCAGAPCNAVAGFSTAARHQCHTITVNAYGSQSDHFLCVYGDSPMSISPANPNIIGVNGNTYNINLSNGRADENYTWELVEPLPSYLSWVDNIGKDAILRFSAPNTNLSVTSYTIRVKQNTVPLCDAATTTLTVQSTGDKIFTGAPVDIVFVVDVSGSMGMDAQCACEGNPTCPNPPGKTKLKYLKEELINLFNQMKSIARTDDRIGLVSFHTTSTPESVLKSFGTTDFINKINGWSDNGYDFTAMGKGLQTAIPLFVNPTHKKYIILMTNGMQNEPPMAVWTDPAKTAVKVGSTVFDQSLGIQVLPIAIFTPDGEYKDILKKLGSGTNADGADVIGDVCESNLSLLTAYKTAAESIGSPKLVTFKRDVFVGTSTTGIFKIEENLDKLLVNIINVGNQNFNGFKIEKNINNSWVDITALGNMQPPLAQADIKRLFTLEFPKILNGVPLNSAGDYRYTANSTIPNIPYEFSVIIDDRGIKHTIHTGDIRYQAGDPLFLSASVRYNNLPVLDANVTVSLASPVASFSTGLGKGKMPGKYVTVEKIPLREGKYADVGLPSDARSGTVFASGNRLKFPIGIPYIKQYTIQHPTISSAKKDGERMSNADRKYHVLLEEKGFGDIFKTSANAIQLKHVGNGIYKAEFPNTQKVGLYNLNFHISGDVNPVGKVERLDAKSVNVSFGKPVLSKSNLQLMWESPLVISMRPQDAFGNLLGPGNAEQVSVYISKGVASTPYDYLDGRYIVRLSGLTEKDDPNIIIRIGTDVLFNGKLSDLARRKCFFAIQGGYSIPQSAFDSSYNPGYLAELKFGRRFIKGFGGQLHAGYYNFISQSNSDNFNILGGGAGLFYRFPLSNSQGWNLHAELNGGYYKPKDLDGAFGYNGGIGVSAYLNYWISIVVEGKYYKILSKPDQIDFIGATAGIRFHF